MVSYLKFTAMVGGPGLGTGVAVGEPPPEVGAANGESLRTLLRPTLARLSALSAVLAYTWFLWGLVAGDRGSNWRTSLPGLALCLGATLAILAGSHYRLGAIALLTGLVASALVDAAIAGNLVGHWLLLVAILAAGVLSGPLVALLTAAVLVPLSLVVLPWPASWPLLRALLTGGGLVWAIGGSIFHALTRSRRNEVLAWQRASEAMSRRGEWQRASKALHDMYSLLERTNRELEVARREAEDAREIKARFAANISHELRTPLNLIMGFSRIMHRSPSVYGAVNWTPELRSDVRQMYNASRHLLGMIDDILDLSRIEAQRLPLKLEKVGLAMLLEEAASTAQGLLRDSPVSLSVSVASDLPDLMVDQTRIRQVLLNLLGNAIRFTDSGRIDLKAWADEREVHVSVSDTGIGIAAADLPGIFNEFSQAGRDVTGGRGGAGLGLAVCRQFVTLHGGHMKAESEEGRGSTFRFSLPLEQPWGGRARLAYYAPEGWSPPLPENSLGETIIALGPHEAAARVLARGIPNLRILPVTEFAALSATVEREHPLGVVIARDPLAAETGAEATDVWDSTGRPDLGVVVCEMPLEEAARSSLGVDAFLTKPVQPDDLADVACRLRPGARRLLAVDDDPGFLALLERVVCSALPGVSPVLCGDGEQALALAREQTFDLVILDLVMPHLGGTEFLRRAREEGLLAGAALIVATGAPYVEELAAAFPAKLTFLRKAPPKSDRWLECVATVFASAPPDYSRPARQPEPAAVARP